VSIEAIANISLVIITGILVIITGIYVFLTYLILRANRDTIKEMQKQNESYLRPYILISVFIPSGSIVFYLRIKNIGKSIAGNVKLEMDRDFYQFGGNNASDNIKTFACFASQIKSFPPDSEINLELAQGFVVFGEKGDPLKTPKSFVVTARYDWENRHYVESTTIDLNPYLGSISPPDPMYEILKEIKNELANVHQFIKSAK
jgi:hypothetical protein